MQNEIVNIDDAERWMVAEYGEYCNEKLLMNETPFTFEQWQQANIDMAD